MLEKIIAYHCAPALAGIKPANIVACYKDKIPNIQAEIHRFNQEMNQKDIYFEILCECDRRALVMVYRKEKLKQYLQRNEISVFLKSVGYPQEFTLIVNIVLHGKSCCHISIHNSPVIMARKDLRTS